MAPANIISAARLRLFTGIASGEGVAMHFGDGLSSEAPCRLLLPRTR
jgi:hypothetical protein